MKSITVVGLVLIVLGIVGFAVGGFSFTHEKHDATIGPIDINHKSTETVPIPPILSAISLVGGVGLVIAGARS
jgi:hypothetical protein